LEDGEEEVKTGRLLSP